MEQHRSRGIVSKVSGFDEAGPTAKTTTDGGNGLEMQRKSFCSNLQSFTRSAKDNPPTFFFLFVFYTFWLWLKMKEKKQSDKENTLNLTLSLKIKYLMSVQRSRFEP